ncbi:MAG: hypothetical protein RJA98_2019 [Pseudomonadota bacterium]|jgi:hypothetical protein
MQHLDFHRRRPPTPWWAAVLCAVAATACVLLALELWGGWRMQREQAEDAQRVQAMLDRRLQPAVSAAPVANRVSDSVNANRSSEAALRARAVWQASLERPWLELLNVLEQHAAPRVPVQQLSVDARFETAQLQVEARNLGELFAYVNALHTAGAPLRSAQLLGHEWVNEGGVPGAGSPAAGEGAKRLRARIVLKLATPVVALPANAMSSDNSQLSASARTGA